MRRVMANALVTLLALLLSVSASRGEEIWVSYNDGTLEWSCQKIEGTETCKIKPANKSDIQGAVTIPSEVTIDGKTLKVVTVAEEAFSNCTKLSEVSIPEGIEAIEKGAFSGCEELLTLQLPQSLKVIEEKSFEGCALSSVNIPANVESIGYDAFQDCSELKKFEVAVGNGHFSEAGGVLFNNDKTALLCYPMGLSAESYDIPASVKSIGACAFYGNGILKTVNIPDGVTAIGESAFSGCSVLEKVVVPKGVTTIEQYTFYGCEKLSSVELPGGVEAIGEAAFSTCESLKRVELHEGLTSIGESAFAFSNNLSEVTIPTSVTEIGDGAFSGTALTSVAIPAGVKKLGGVFPGCLNLEKVTLPEGLEGLDGTFFGCGKLTEITIPASVTTVGVGTFSNTALTSVAIPAGVKELPEAFTDCPNLEKVTLPEGLEILNGTFSRSKKLTEITIPASVNSITGETFSGCSALNRVYYLAAADAAVADNAFEGIANPAILIVRREDKAAIETKAWVKNGKFTMVAEKNKVTFSTDGGLPVPDVQRVKYGENAVRPAEVPVKEGFKFEGWILNNVDYKFDIPVSEDIELTAKYVAEYTLTITSGANGSVKVTRNNAQGDALTGAAKLHEGDKLFIAATPAVGYELETLTVNGAAFANSSVFTVGKANVEVKATFKAKGGATSPSAVESVQLTTARVVQNPIANALVLEGISTAERIEVYSLTGVQTYACAPRGKERVEIATGSWASGIYVVRIIAADGEKTLRVVK